MVNFNQSSIAYEDLEFICLIVCVLCSGRRFVFNWVSEDDMTEPEVHQLTDIIHPSPVSPASEHQTPI